MRRAVGAALVAAACLAPARPAAAHPVPFSYLDLRLQPDAVEAALVVHVLDVAHDLEIEPATDLLDPAFVRMHEARIAALISRRLHVGLDGRRLTLRWTRVEALADRQALRLSGHAPLAGAVGRVEVGGLLFPYDPRHRTFVNLYEGDALTQAIVDLGQPSYEYFAGTRQGRLAVVARFLPSGIHHILIGPDHLLFLVGLLLLGGSLKRLALVVTGFTIAHSVTLSLAALNLFNPPARLIEPAIALSIIYVGVDNLLVKDGRDVRTWIAFGFGLVHGFGFAGVLREMGLGGGALGWSLFSFNLGVEVGQLLVVAAVATLLGALRSRSEALGRQVAFAGSIVVMAAGAFWFAERVFFFGGL